MRRSVEHVAAEGSQTGSVHLRDPVFGRDAQFSTGYTGAQLTRREPVRTRYVLTLSAVVVLSLITGAMPARASSGPSLAVTPDVGLVEGQTVAIRGTGFQPSQFVAVVICPTAQLGVFPPDSLEAALYLSTVCSFANNTTSTTAHPDGTFAATFTVTRDNTTTSPGPPFPPAGPPFRCGLAPSDCVILAGSVVGRFVEASAPISFTPPVPISTDECRHDGWRHRADDRGRPFRNQGQCVRFVVHHR